MLEAARNIIIMMRNVMNEEQGYCIFLTHRQVCVMISRFGETFRECRGILCYPRGEIDQQLE